MISWGSCHYSWSLLLSHLTMVFNSNRKCFRLPVYKVDLASLSTIVSSFLSCFNQIEVPLGLVLYEALILEFEWIRSCSQRAACWSSGHCGLSKWSCRIIIESDIEIGTCSRRLGSIQRLGRKVWTLLCVYFPLKNINKLWILGPAVWTLVEMWSSLCRHRSLGFVLIRLLDEWLHGSIHLVILLLLFLLTYRLLERSYWVELTHSILI